MRAIDVMVRDVVTVHPDTDIADAIRLLAEHDVSARPVVDTAGSLVGVLSEADLIHRVEIGTEQHRPWWPEAVTGASSLAAEFAKSHGKKVGEIMTSGVVSVSEDTPISEIATLLERKGIKRVPVARAGKLVGIVTVKDRVVHLWGSSGRRQNVRRCARLQKGCRECLGFPTN
jgi:CBS domain-containing protein